MRFNETREINTVLLSLSSNFNIGMHWIIINQIDLMMIGSTKLYILILV